MVLEALDTLLTSRTTRRLNAIGRPTISSAGREGRFNVIKGIPPSLRYEAGTIVADPDSVIVYVNWIAGDILRIEDGILVEHGDLIQGEATEERSKSSAQLDQFWRIEI
jgi:hypothetical protein